MITPIHTAILAAPIAVLYAVVLAGEDTPLNRWFRWLERMADHKGWRSWIAITALAKADVFVTIISDGGNGTADPEFSAAYFEVR